MDFKQLCKERYSARSYLSKEVEREKIEYILECARLAPSAANRQPWIYYVVTDENLRRQMSKVYHREWFADAPLYIVVCKDTSQSWKRESTDGKDYADVDIAITAEHICLAAHEQGLGTCWICNFYPDVLREVLSIEEPSIEPIVIFPIAYTEEGKETKKVRKKLSEVVKWL